MPTPLKYREKFCNELIKHMQDGYSFDSFGSIADCGRQTLYDWVNKYPEFKEAYAQGKAKALKFYENLLRTKMIGAPFKVDGITAKIDTTLLIFTLKTRFHKVYGEKQQIEQTIKEIKIEIDSEDAGL